MCICGECISVIPDFRLNINFFREFKRKHAEKDLYEIYYPGKFTQVHPWGTTIDDEWDEAISGDPFCYYCIQGDLLSKLKGLRFSISKLCHVTHNEQAQRIQPNSLDSKHYIFKPKQKCGKEYIFDGRPLGETYLNIVPFCDTKKFPGNPTAPDEMQYQKIPGAHPVLPGYYSWWGLSLEDQFPRFVTDTVHSLEQMGTYVAGYVKTPPESSYGNNAFCLTLHNLLKSYADSRQRLMSKIHLKVGGTLRYRYEVCYILIICAEDDLKTLSNFKDLTQDGDILVNRVLNPNGLVGQDGGVINPRAIPTFTPQHVISWYSGTRKSISWEGIAFAFYFPSGDLTLKCPTETIEQREISHRFCTSTQPPTDPWAKKWVCPNLNYYT